MSAKLLSSVVVAAVLRSLPFESEAQLPRDPVERARVISQIMEANARQLTLFDRAGPGSRCRRTSRPLQPAGFLAGRETRRGDQAGSGQGNERPLGHRCRYGQRHPDHLQPAPRGSKLAGVVAGRKPGGVRRTARGLLRSLSQGVERPGDRGTPLPELGADDAHRLVAGRTPSDVLLDRPFGWRLVRAAAERAGRAETDRSLPQQVATAGSASLARQPLHDVRLERDGAIRNLRASDSIRGCDRAGDTGARVSDQGGTGMVFWRRDGKELYYLARRSGNHGGGGRRRHRSAVRQAGAVVPPSARHRARRGARAQPASAATASDS